MKVHFFMNIIFFFFVFENTNCETNIIEIKPGDFKSESLKYEVPSLLKFNTSKIPFLVHINSINCEIEVYLNNSLKEQKEEKEEKEKKNIKMIKNNDTFLINIDKAITNMYVRPLNIQKDNINYRNCPIVINSMSKNDFLLNIKEENPTVFYFNKELKNLKLSFDLGDYFNNNTFITFSFIFYEKATFKINIPGIKYGQERIISNSHNVFLTKKSFKDFSSLENIIIDLELIDYTDPVLVQFRVITNGFNPQILQKNYLNQGFITSDLKYQHYYIEIFKGEEVEIMLHDKRQYGKLIGKIEDKNKTALLNSSFPDEENDNNDFKENIKKLSFSYESTEKCDKGCYLLISYFHNTFEEKEDIIGYEFTLLPKIWNKEDFSDTNIVNIPEKEYILGFFELDSINVHYYSIFIPEEIEKVVVELSGYYINFFYGQGKKKLNTYNSYLDTIEEIKLKNGMAVESLDFKNKYISFAIRSKDFFTDTHSYYYFRVFLLKNEKHLIVPIDSNLANLCLPLKNGSDYFDCYALLTNYYNEFSHYSSLYPSSSNYEKRIFSYNSNKTSKLDISNEALNNLCENLTDENKINIQDNNLDFILIKYSFILSDDIQTFFTYFYDENKEIYPQVYSPQIFKISYIKMVNFINKQFMENYSLFIKWINGAGDIKDLIPKKLHLNKNQKDKLYSIPISDIRGDDITIESNNLDIYMQLIYNINNNYKGEINDKVIISEIIDELNLPIYFYSSINKFGYYNKDIILKVLNLNEDSSKFSIEAMYYSQFDIYEFKNEKYVNFHSDLTIEYDNCLKSGFLRIYYDKLKEDEDYIIIKIDKSNKKPYEKILIEINCFTFLVPEFLEFYTRPYNQFIFGYYHNLSYMNNISYQLILDDDDNDYIILEFSRNLPEINISFNVPKEVYYKDGIEKYKIKKQNEKYINLTLYLDEIYEHNNLLQGNYIFRYYYVPNGFFDPKYELDTIYNIKDKEIIEDNTIRLLFEFNNIQIINIPENYTNNIIYYTIYCNLFLFIY